MESCKKERAKGLKWSSCDKKEERRMDGKCSGGCGGGSEEEEGYILHSPLNTSGISSRKRIKLHGKVGLLLTFSTAVTESLKLFSIG